MSAVPTLDGARLRLQVRHNLEPTIRAAAASIGPEGRRLLYAVGNATRHSSSGVDIVRRLTGGRAEEIMLREAVVAAERDLKDGTARLVVMVGAALDAGYRAVAAGEHPTHLIRIIDALAAELDADFAAVTSPDADTEALLRAADIPDTAARAVEKALAEAGPEGRVELAERTEPGLAVQSCVGFTADMEPLLSGTLGHLDRVFLLVANDVISDFRRLAPVIEGFAESNKTLVIVARGVEGAARQLLERNRAAGVLRVSALRPKDQGPRAAQILTDLAIATGAALVAEETGLSLDTFKPHMLGRAESLRRHGDRITLAGPAGDADRKTQRLREIEGEIVRHRYLELDRVHAERRHARLRGRWVELQVGSDPLQPDLAGRVKRALGSVQSAREGGQIDGAGLGLSAVASRIAARGPATATERAARAIVCRALRAPAYALARNAGRAEQMAHWQASLPPLADPARLSRSVLDMALSLALQFLSLEVAVQRR